jgi:hypothetical protein
MNIIQTSKLFQQKDTVLRDEILKYLEFSHNKLNELLKKGSDIDIVKFLVADTYNFNIYSSYVGLKLITSEDHEFWDIIDHKLVDASELLLSDARLYNRLVTILAQKKESISSTHITFIHRIVSGFIKKGIHKDTKRIKNISTMIRNNKNKVIHKLEHNPVINIDKHLLEGGKSKRSDSKVKIELTRDNYFYLLNTISDANVRSKIETAYNMKSDSIMTDICKIIVLRQHYATELGYGSYFDYINNKNNNSNDIKELILDLISKVDLRATNEIERIRTELAKDGFNRKVEYNDIIYYHNKLQSKLLFKPSTVFATIFKSIDKYFSISFVPSNKPKWNNNVVVFDCVDKHTRVNMGILYLDMTYVAGKRVDSPMFIKLSDKYQINGNMYLAEVCITANYKDINTKCMSYNEIVQMYREFGHVLQNISYISHTGLINYDKSFSNFLSQIMEYIAWERDTIEQIAPECTPEQIDHIIFGRNIDVCYSIKMRCIQASVDHIIHNSKNFTSLVNEYLKESKSTPNILTTLYKKTFTEMMNKSRDILNTDMQSIPPYFIAQMINGSEGILYGNISSEILSYAVFSSIKDGKGEQFRKEVLEPTDKPFNNLLLQFISSIDTDTYNLYLSKIIGLDIENDDELVTENTNFFDDKDSDSENDVDNVIILNRNHK